MGRTHAGVSAPQGVAGISAVSGRPEGSTSSLEACPCCLLMPGGICRCRSTSLCSRSSESSREPRAQAGAQRPGGEEDRILPSRGSGHGSSAHGQVCREGTAGGASSAPAQSAHRDPPHPPCVNLGRGPGPERGSRAPPGGRWASGPGSPPSTLCWPRSRCLLKAEQLLKYLHTRRAGFRKNHFTKGACPPPSVGPGASARPRSGPCPGGVGSNLGPGAPCLPLRGWPPASVPAGSQGSKVRQPQTSESQGSKAQEGEHRPVLCPGVRVGLGGERALGSGAARPDLPGVRVRACGRRPWLRRDDGLWMP